MENEPKNIDIKMLAIIFTLVSVLIISGISFYLISESKGTKITIPVVNSTTNTNTNTNIINVNQDLNTNYFPYIAPSTAMYDLYLCPGVTISNPSATDCFYTTNLISDDSTINIHGSYINNVGVDWQSLFVVVKDCPTCDVPRYLDFDTATRSMTACSISGQIDPNNFGVFNQFIYPSTDDWSEEILSAKDHVRIEIDKYFKEGNDIYMIQASPAGCDLLVTNFQVL
ncbi:MAG: hypothetical protein ACNFW9_00800 [Candidatus Kerfeldbacteria bacterium]|jgi:hypothetical protein